MTDKKQLAQEWYWSNLTESAPVTLLTEPAKYPPDPIKAFIAGYEAGHSAGYEACLHRQEALDEIADNVLRDSSDLIEFLAESTEKENSMEEYKTYVNKVTGDIFTGPITMKPFTQTELYVEVVRCRDGMLRAVDEVDSNNRWNRQRPDPVEVMAKVYSSKEEMPPDEYPGYQIMAIERAFRHGYEARRLQEKQEFADAYSHGSPIQQIAKEYVARRGTADNLAPYEENRFIDGYLFALKQQELK